LLGSSAEFPDERPLSFYNFVLKKEKYYEKAYILNRSFITPQ
jgi:hypothetical protein